MKPVKVFGEYVVCFEALPEDEPMRRHFINFCGWTPAQFRKIKDFQWFCARVSLWRDGVQLAYDYLGRCCYTTADEFWIEHQGDYFADMVRECAHQVNDPGLRAVVDSWHANFRRAAV